MQALGFGSPSDTLTLVKLLEALFFTLTITGQQTEELLKWVETVTEAFFLQLSVFGGNTAEEELNYAYELIEKIEGKLDQ